MISTWYVIIRNIALIVSMLTLIYTGIRIVIGSTAGEKAKYKERIMDWIIAICLICIMHYIMVFSITLVEKFTNLVSVATGENYTGIVIPLNPTQTANAQKMNWAAFGGENAVLIDSEDGSTTSKTLVWSTNLAGLFKLKAQFENEGTLNWIGYSFCYVVLTIFTLFFAFTYIKRVIYIAFLTMIAPLVAMTYPIDKITDGKAQAFNSWLKEYIFNLMIQPLHLLLYTILVTSAFQLAAENAIYALVAIGFMMPAEKLMRKFFGFEKAHTPGLLGGAAGAALAMTGLQKLLGHKSSGGNNDKNGDNAKNQNKVRFANKNQNNSMDGISGRKPGDKNTAQNEKKMESNDAKEPETSKAPEVAKAQKVENEATKKQPNASNTNKRSIKRAVGAVLGNSAKQIGTKALKGFHPMKLAGKVAAGATVATAGMLLGVASGDPSKAFQYTTAGAMAGSAFANNLSKKKVLDMKELKDEWEMARWGEEYKNKMIEKQREEFIKNRDNISYLKRTMGMTDEEAKQMLSETGGQCFDNGITKIEDIAAIHKLMTEPSEDGDTMSFKYASAARDYATKRLPSNIDSMGQKSIQEHKERWANEFKERYGISDAEAMKLANNAFDAAIRFSDAKAEL